MLVVMEKASLSLLLMVLVVVSLLSHTNAVKYKKGDRIQLYVNKVGPYYNPQETYHYYSLPVCTPDKVEHRSLTLGEVLDGDRMAVSLYEVKYNVSSSHKELCTRELSNKDIEKLQAAIEDLYYFEFVFDDLTMRGFIGHLEEGSFLPHHHKTFLWTHLHFSFSCNDKEIVEANVTTTGATPLSLDEIEGPLRVTFTYSTSWFKTTKKRSEANSQQISFFPKSMEIHWLSIVNSVVLVCLLLGFVTLILMRVLHNDFSRYNINDEDNDDLEQDNYGWKIISSDVFRFPSNKNLLCAILGVGSQFLFLSLSLIVLALLGMFNVHRHHAMNSAGILLYAFTSCVAGYVSARLYRKMNGENWVWNVILTACLFAVPFLVVWSTVNTVALYHHSTQALPFTTILLITIIWMIIGFPLTVLGGILGKNSTLPRFDAPCRTKNIPREIPHLPWYHTLPVQMIVGGFLPFSSISVELYYIFATVWGREAYTLYGILLVVFLILISVTCCISITLTYFVLAAEDYRWWWRSVFNAGSTGLFVFAYALFYFCRRSHMNGVLQTLEYFGYTLLACYIFFLMLGTVSFFSSLTFVQYMYRNLKTD